MEFIFHPLINTSKYRLGNIDLHYFGFNQLFTSRYETKEYRWVHCTIQVKCIMFQMNVIHEKQHQLICSDNFFVKLQPYF